MGKVLTIVIPTYNMEKYLDKCLNSLIIPVGITFSFEHFAKKDVPYMWMHAVTHRTEKMRRIGYQQQEGISYTGKEFVFYPMAFSETLAYFPKVLYEYVTGRE